MTSFLSGAAIAVALAVVMYVAMSTLYVPTELRYSGDNLHLTEHLVEATVASE